MPKVFKPKIVPKLSQKNQKIDEQSENISESSIKTLTGPPLPEEIIENGRTSKNVVVHEIAASAETEKTETPVKILKSNASSFDSQSFPECTYDCFESSSVDIDAEPPNSYKSSKISTTESVKLFAVKQTVKRHEVYGEVPPPADKPLDRSTVTLRSLLNWIPANKPPPKVRDIDPNPKPSKGEKSPVAPSICKSVNKKCDDTPIPTPGEPNIDPFAPQVCLDADGNIVLDYNSLHVSHPENVDKGNLRHVAEEAGLYSTTYNSFRRHAVQHRGKNWSERNTTRFYRALSTIGTDFYQMAKLFPDRTRNQLVNKYKREMRLFPHLVDEALKNRRNYDITAFYNSDSDLEEKYENLTKDAIAEKRKASKDKSDRPEPKKRSTCDIFLLIDEVLARDSAIIEDTGNDTERPLKACRTTRAAAAAVAAAPCSLTKMIEKTAEGSSKIDQAASSSITS